VTGVFTATDVAGWLMVGSFIAVLWIIAVMVMIDPPVLVFRFMAPALALAFTCALVIMGLAAT
jgi:hypothetical protein